MCLYGVRNRLALVFVYRGCQKGVDDNSRVRLGHIHRHTRDLSALIDVASRDYVEVGTCGKYTVKVDHPAVLPEEAVGPVASGVKGVSHHLALVVDAGGKGGNVSRQKAAEGFDCIVLPKSGQGCAVRVNGLPNNLAVAVNGVGYGVWISEVRKRGGSVVFPHNGVIHCGAGSRVAYDLTLIVDADCLSVWIVIDRRKNLGFAFGPQHRHANPIISHASRARGVHDTIFRPSCDLSAVIDGAGLLVISAHRWETDHDAVFPKKRKTRKVCAETANVFAVRIWNRRFGHTQIG